jgi:Flp pilus assembly protein TadD
VRRAALVEVGGYNEQYTYAQDYDLWLRLSEVGLIRNLDEYLYLLRSWPGNITTIKLKEQTEFAELAIRQALQRRYGNGPIDREVSYGFVKRAITWFNLREYVNCINTLNNTQKMAPNITKRFKGYDLLLALAYFAIGREQQCLTCLRREIQNHNNPAAGKFLSDYFEKNLRMDVQNWCSQNSRHYNLQLVDLEKESCQQRQNNNISEPYVSKQQSEQKGIRQSLTGPAVLYQGKGETARSPSSLEKILSTRHDFGWAKDMLPDAARQSSSTESQTGRQKILFYFDRIGNLNETSPAGTVIAVLNFARALQSSNPDIKVHITGDFVRYLEKYESFQVVPLPNAEERGKFLTDYDVVFFATHIRYFQGLTKPSGQIWVLYQHCWEAGDYVSLSHTSDFDIVICLSELHRASLREQHIGNEKLITIPNLIDTNVYSPGYIHRNNHSIMFAGGLHPHKCIHILLDAFRLVRQQVQDAELHIYGDGQMWRGGDDYGNYLKGIKPEGVHFHGYVSNKDMPQIYSKHSILCLPSKLETFPMVIVEAQACGCIPVAHNAGGVTATLADEQTGLLYSPNTPEKLAETIIKAIKIVDADPSVRQKAINFVRNTFSINRAAEYISKLWDKINIAKKVNTIRTLLKDNEIEQADLKCKELLQEYPNDPDVLLSQALVMLQQGNKPKANVAIEKLLENFPNHLRALNDFGLTAMKAGDTEKALRYLTKAYKFNPWDKDTITNCYAMLTTSGKYRDAKMLLLNYLTNVGEDAQVLQLFSEIDNLIANAGSGTKVVSKEVLNNRQDVYCGSNTSMPLVSIITPVYNGADYIGQTIESVLTQDYPNFELVIIDDGSTDNTKEVILRYNDGRIRYLYQENKGVSSARNLAIKKAKGQYIMPLDADDMMTPDFIVKHLAEFEKYPEVDLVYCDVLLIDGNSKPIRIMNKPEYQDRRHLIRDLFRAGHPIIPFRFGIKRSVFDKIGFYDEDLLIGEDYDMMRRFVKAGLKAHHLSEPLHLRRIYADSLSRNCSAQKAKSHFDVVKRFTDTFTYDELFPDIEWDKIAPQMRQLHAKCLAAGNYLAIGQGYVKTNAAECSRIAFDLACSELNDCVKMDPKNQGLRQLLQKSKLIRAKYTEAPQQVVS